MTAGPGRDYVYAGIYVVILKCHPRKQDDAGFANVHNRKRRNFTLQEERQPGTRDMRARKNRPVSLRYFLPIASRPTRNFLHPSRVKSPDAIRSSQVKNSRK